MCGLVGAFSARSGISAEVVKGMASALRHRGPDDAGTWCDPEVGIALGHRRLSIIDLSPEGHQPMVSACGRYVIAYNGEIYNFQDLRAELLEAGSPSPVTGHPPLAFRGHSDTEVLLAAIGAWGLIPTLERANGMFAFALWDRQERTLTLARDRLGKKPLYFGWSSGALVFGSELKALRAFPGFANPIDRDVLHLYLRHHCIPAPSSIYQGIYKLPPASLLTLRANILAGGAARSWGELAPMVERYWSSAGMAETGTRSLLPGSDDELAEDLDALLRDAVGCRMLADVPLGAFLSGGIDSSVVVALMQAQSDRPVKTFSIGSHHGEYNEAEFAAAVARHLGTDHTELYLSGEEARAVIPALPTIFDEPFSDSSQIATYLVSRLARQSVTVALSGDGGDELFGGYNRHSWAPKVLAGVGRWPSGLRRGLASGLSLLTPAQWDALVGRLEPVLPQRLRMRRAGDKLQKLASALPARGAEDLYLRLVSHWPAPEEVVVGGREPLSLITDPSRHPALVDFASRMMYLDLVTYLPDDILVKVDRASMAVSLEARAPLLDYRLVEFAWRLPLAAKIREGQGKWLLRQVLFRYVPRDLIERPKMGFAVPIDAWLRGPLRDWAEALLDEGRLRQEGYFNPAPIRRKWREHLAGKRNWQDQLWDILMFQAWLEEGRR